MKTDSLVHEHERRESRRESRREARRQSAIAVEQKATDLQILMEAAQRQLVEVHGETPEAAAAAARPPLVTEGTTALQLLMADAARKLEQAGGGTWRASPGGTWRQDTAAMVEPGAALELEVFVVQGRLKGQPPSMPWWLSLIHI